MAMVAAAAALSASPSAQAQPAPAAARGDLPGGAARRPAGGDRAPEARAGAAAGGQEAGEAEPAPPSSPIARAILKGEREDPLAAALAPEPLGLQPSQVAKSAAATSPAVAVGRAELQAAAGKVDQAIAAYFPTGRLSASYTRVSEVPTDFDIGIPLPPGTQVPSLPLVLNQWALTASLSVPVSDYLLRLTQAYATVSLDEDAKKLQIRAAEQQAAMEAKVAYFNWIRARGRTAVAELSAEQAEQHVKDAEMTLTAGLISKADLLRLQAQKAQAEHLVRASRAFEQLAAEQVRTRMHLPPAARLAVGIDVMQPPAERAEPPPAELLKQAYQNRPELGALHAAERSLDEALTVARATYYPRLDAFADAMYANPNPRIFPQAEKWDFTWDVGARLSWTINDTFTTIGISRQVEASKSQVVAQRRALEDGIRVAVMAAYQAIATARSAITAADIREQAAEASLDARRKLFRGGKATATDMIDADAELTAARLQRVDAHVDLLVAQAQLAQAVGAPT